MSSALGVDLSHGASVDGLVRRARGDSCGFWPLLRLRWPNAGPAWAKLRQWFLSLCGLQKASQRLANDLRSGGTFGLGSLEELVAQLGVQSD
jgi:hypothetical protein